MDPTMIGLVLVTHGRLANELVAAMEHVVGPQESVECVCIGPDDDMEERQSQILAAVRKCDLGEGVILLTDMFGGTPSNLAISVMDQANIEVVAGVNLPMLIKLASLRHDLPLHVLAEEAVEAGRRYINIASQIMSGTK